MARGDSYEKLPSKLYYLKSLYTCNGPYTKRPTLLQKKEGGTILEFELNNEGNYIQKKL